MHDHEKTTSRLPRRASGTDCLRGFLVSIVLGSGVDRATMTAARRAPARAPARRDGTDHHRGAQATPPRHLHHQDRPHPQRHRRRDRDHGRGTPGANPELDAKPGSGPEHKAARVKLGRRTLVLAALIAAATPAPRCGAAERPPAVPGARAAIVVDARDGTVMFAKHPDAERAIASTTKLMTALLALEQAKPSDVFTAPAYNAMPAESRINLREGERMTVHDLLEALLLESANDAAETLAEGVSGSREAFVEEMNARAAELGLEHTSYANPIGLDEGGNYRRRGTSPSWRAC